MPSQTENYQTENYQPEMYQFDFKIVYTTFISHLSFDLNLTISQFLNCLNSEYMKEYLHIHNGYRIEILEIGNNVNGDAELAPALQPSEETLREKYGNILRNTSFYIRPVRMNVRHFERRNDYSIIDHNI
jgi:hypothetical protein